MHVVGDVSDLDHSGHGDNNSSPLGAYCTQPFAPGQTSAQATVLIHGDVSVEANERFLISIGSPVGMTTADATATGYILNDD